jgi:hypothetical protein
MRPDVPGESAWLDYAIDRHGCQSETWPCSNSHFEVLAGIGRQRDLQSLEHAVQAMVPALNQEIARQGLQVLKAGVPGR